MSGSKCSLTCHSRPDKAVVEHHCRRINHDDHVLLPAAQSFHSCRHNHKSRPCPPRELQAIDCPPLTKPMNANNNMRLESQCRSREGHGVSPCLQLLYSSCATRRIRAAFLSDPQHPEPTRTTRETPKRCQNAGTTANGNNGSYIPADGRPSHRVVPYQCEPLLRYYRMVSSLAHLCGERKQRNIGRLLCR